MVFSPYGYQQQRTQTGSGFDDLQRQGQRQTGGSTPPTPMPQPPSFLVGAGLPQVPQQRLPQQTPPPTGSSPPPAGGGASSTQNEASRNTGSASGSPLTSSGGRRTQAVPGWQPVLPQTGQQGANDLQQAGEAVQDARRRRDDPFGAQLEDQWKLIEETMQGGLDSQLRDVDRQTALNARRANEMNALGGGSVGGAFNAGQAQAQLGGMAMRQNAITDQMKRSVEARMAYLQMLLARAQQASSQAFSAEEAEKNRQQQILIQDKMNELQAALYTGQGEP